jgi:hypothetical protein
MKNQQERREEVAAYATMAIVAAVAIVLIFALIFKL